MADYLTPCVRVGWISENGEPILHQLPCTRVRRQAGPTRVRERLIISGLQPTADPVDALHALDPLPEYLDFTPTDSAPQAFQILTMTRDPATGNLLVEVHAYA